MPEIQIFEGGELQARFVGTPDECAEFSVCRERRQARACPKRRPRVWAGGMVDLTPYRARLARVRATTQFAQTTVIAQVAVEQGLDGLDAPLLGQTFKRLGLGEIASPGTLLSNARARGLVERTRPGIWRPTEEGRRFAAVDPVPAIESDPNA